MGPEGALEETLIVHNMKTLWPLGEGAVGVFVLDANYTTTQSVAVTGRS